MQQVGNAQQKIVEFGLDGIDGRITGLQLARQFLGTREQRGGVLLPALGDADGLRIGIALGAHAVGFDLRRLAALLERIERGHVEREPAAGEIGGDTGGIGTQLLGIEH